MGTTVAESLSPTPSFHVTLVCVCVCVGCVKHAASGRWQRCAHDGAEDTEWHGRAGGACRGPREPLVRRRQRAGARGFPPRMPRRHPQARAPRWQTPRPRPAAKASGEMVTWAMRLSRG